MDGKHTYYLSENTVKAAKDLIADRQAQTRENGQKVSRSSTECSKIYRKSVL